MKRLAILSIVLLMFTGCGDDDDSGQKSSLVAPNKINTINQSQIKYNLSGNIQDTRGTDVGDWNFDSTLKVININMNRVALNGLELSAVPEGFSGPPWLFDAGNGLLFQLSYVRNDIALVRIGDLFSTTITVLLPEDAATQALTDPFVAQAKYTIDIYDQDGNFIKTAGQLVR